MVPELGIGSVRTISSFSRLEMQHVRMGLTDVGTSGIRSASSGSESVNTSAAGSGINPLVRERCVDSFPRSPEHEWGNIFFDGCGHKFVHESPIWIFKDCMVMRAMAQYFLSVRAMKLSRGFELNTDARMLEDGAQLTARKISEKTEAAKRPFELGQSRHFVAMEDGQVIQFLSRVESEVESLRYQCFVFYHLLHVLFIFFYQSYETVVLFGYSFVVSFFLLLFLYFSVL